MVLDCLGRRWSKVPGQEIGDPVNGMVCDAPQELAKIKLRIDAVQLRRADQGVKRCGPLAAAI